MASRWHQSLWWIQAFLGLAVGVTAGALIVFDATVWRPIKTPNASRVYALGGLTAHPSLGDAVAWWSQVPAFEIVALYRAGDVVVRASGDEQWKRAAEVSTGFFHIFGITPAPGRTCGEADARSLEPAVLVSHSLWSDLDSPKVLQIGRRSFRVIGVVPSGFSFPSGADLWTCRHADRVQQLELLVGTSSLPPVRSETGWLGLLRRTERPAVAHEQLAALLDRTNQEIGSRSGLNYGDMVSVRSVQAYLSSDASAPALVFLIVCSALLLLATLNCAFCFVAAVNRTRMHFQIRRALGASAIRAMAPIVKTALWSSTVAGGIGSVTAFGCITAARNYLHVFRIHMEPPTVYFLGILVASFGLSVLVAMVSGIAAGASALKADPSGLIRQGIAGNTGGRLVRRSLVTLQVAGAVLLVAGAITAIRSYMRLVERERGHTIDQVLTINFAFPRRSVDGELVRVVQQELFERIGKVESVSGVAATNEFPITAAERGFRTVLVDGRELMAASRDVAGDYPNVLQIPVVRGSRSVREGELAINARLAAALWPDGEALGRYLFVGGEQSPRLVASVLGDTRLLDEEYPPYEIYRPVEPLVDPNPSAVRFSVMVRLDEQLTPAGTEAIIAALGPDYARRVVRVGSMRGLLAHELGPRRAQSAVWIICALLGMVAALSGVAVTVSLVVTQRGFEAGVRAACGATPVALIRLFAFDGFVCIALGVVIGCVAAALAIQTGRGLLWGLESLTFGSLVLAVVPVILTGMTAATLPALRMARNAQSLLRVR